MCVLRSARNLRKGPTLPNVAGFLVQAVTMYLCVCVLSQVVLDPNTFLELFKIYFIQKQQLFVFLFLEH